MQCETTLYSFTALVGGQVGTAVITTGGFVWRAIGGVSSVTEVLASDIKKFQVTPSKSSKAILKFDREGEGVKPLTAQVVLTEDQRCGKSDAETATRCRVILEEARALIVNQKHWRCNAVAPSTASSTTSAASSSSSASSSGKPKTGDGPSRSSNPAGGWGRSLAGTVAPGGGGGERTLVGPPAMEGPAAKKRRLKAAAKGGGDKLARAAAAGKVVGKSAHEAEEEACRMFLLSKDLELNRQFREMCGGEEPVMREDEFWESRSQQVASVRAARVGQREGLEGFWWRKAQEEQDAAFVEGSEGGGGGGKKQKGAGGGSGGSTVKLSLTKSDMAKVFVLYPAVQRLYAAKVPHEVGEVEFWTRFYRSKYLQLRSGGAAGGGSSSASAAGVGGLGGGSSLDGGLFAAVANSDSTPLARTPLETQALLSSVDPTLNLHDVYGDYVADPTCADVYERMVAREEQLPSERDIREQAERATVIAKYNRHALRLLQTAPNRLDPAVAPMSYRTAFHPATAPLGDKTGAPTSSSSSSSSSSASSVVVDDDPNNPRGSAATTQHAAMAEVGAAGPAARAAARDELLEEATVLPGLTKEGLRRAQTTSESGATQIDVCGGRGGNETIPLQLDKSYRRFAGGGEGPSSSSSSSEAVVESAGQNTTATASPATATSHAATSSNALGGSMMRCGAGQWLLPVGGNTAKGESTNAATTATAPVASFLPTFRAALDACDPDYAASLGGGGGVAGVAGGGDAAAKQSKSLLRKAQCVHELLRHLFALLKKARHLGHTQPKRTGDGGAGGGVACFELLAGEEKQKLARLEKRMVEVVGECRAEARNAAAKQAEEEALSSSSQAAHQTPSGRHTKLPAAMGGEVEVGLWRSLERQLQHGFAASEKIKHADRDDRARPQGNEGGWGEARTESTGGGGGGWEVVDSPRG